jgi:hypothetical protein
MRDGNNHKPCWIVKGTNSTRSNVMKRWSAQNDCGDNTAAVVEHNRPSLRFDDVFVLDSRLCFSWSAEEVLAMMRAAVAGSTNSKQCGRQTRFLIQPFMSGLQWECRSYFNRGKFLFALMCEQSRHHGTDKETVTTFKAVRKKYSLRRRRSDGSHCSAARVCLH